MLYELVGFVLNQQFAVSEKLVAGRADDKILLYAAKTVLQYSHGGQRTDRR